MHPLLTFFIGIAVLVWSFRAFRWLRRKCEDACDPVKEWDRLEAQRQMNERVYK